MAQVEFQYNGISTIIQCKENQKMYEICNKFISKSHLNENNLNFIYNGIAGKQFDKNLTFNQIANSFDKARKKMNILVISNEATYIDNNNALVKSKDIICPKCNSDIKIKRIDINKIDLFGCQNNHEINGMPLNEFEKTQMINLKNIVCDICKEKNKYNTYNNEFYKCYECNINICPLCKLKHNKEHNITNYDKIHYMCNKHEGEMFTNYCHKCKKNICSLCEKNHSKHDKQSIGDMILDKKELLNKLNELKKSINIYNENINKIIEVLNNVKENMENYYKLEEYIINNYNQKERNYEILYNINKFLNYNRIIIDNINHINNENNIQNKFIYINNLYNKNNKNEIKLTVKVEKDDINEKIYFLDNTDDEITIGFNLNEISDDDFKEIKERHNHDFLKELNESNTELYINNKKYKYEKYFIPDKEGEYNILLKFNILMTDCSYMFYECFNIINIDLSSFDFQNVTNVKFMFANCCGLANINLFSINTINFNNMSSMFANCSKLTNLDLSSFDTKNVTDMTGLFSKSDNLANINISSFNTQKVKSMISMFFDCSNLTNLDLSSFDTKNVKYMITIFSGCDNLKEIKINPNFNEKLINEIKKEKIKIKYTK